MKYKLKRGVVLFRICGAAFLFPSKTAHAKASFLVSLDEELADYLEQNGPSCDASALSITSLDKLQRLMGLGFVEECRL